MGSKRISNSAISRLKQDYLRLKKDPVPYIVAEPNPTNMLEWFYVVSGPENTPYEGGYYVGRLQFPREFPFKPPSIMMLTPNGRFKTQTRLCLSISDFHPDTWNPAWSVSTILTGLLSFMIEKSPTLGSIETSEDEKRLLAKLSLEYNLKMSQFYELFPELAEKLQDEVDRKEKAANNVSQMTCTASTKGGAENDEIIVTDGPAVVEEPNRVNYYMANFVLFAIFALFALVVKQIILNLKA